MTSASADDIRAHVSSSYSARIARVLEHADDQLPMAGAACCASDCCGGSMATTDGETLSNVARLYAETETSDLPATVTDVAFGCGNPTAIAALEPGQAVLDLGSGGGIDCFLAAKMVGPEGFVYGVDMTSDMVRLARSNAVTVGATNVEFRLGEIEHLPISDASIDVVISNCGINLSPDKGQVFREAFRVLRPGGRLQVSDIVWTKPVPEGVKEDMEQWAGCIAGALQESEYLEHISAAGFEAISSDPTPYPGREGIASAAVVATKPRA